MQPIDTHAVRDPELRRHYARLAEEFVVEARRLTGAFDDDGAQGMMRDARFMRFLANGVPPLKAEEWAWMRGTKSRELPADPDHLQGLPVIFEQGLPDDPAEAMKALRSDERFLPFTSIFSDKEFQAAVLIDGYRWSYARAAAYLQVKVKTLEARYASARRWYTPARKADKPGKRTDNIA